MRGPSSREPAAVLTRRAGTEAARSGRRRGTEGPGRRGAAGSARQVDEKLGHQAGEARSQVGLGDAGGG
ncbi:MAG TPA: hypothetical protein VG244_03410, partial [Acidimicrobiales bacterium]|nr:hypothetical protein [Acidimicrobiales bacterium]